jgi:acetyl esterase/lipase
MDRREFLSRVVTGAAAAAIPWSGEARAAEEAWPLRLSTSTVQFGSLPVEAACERIAKLGFEAVDFWHAGFGCPHLDEIEKRLGPAGLKDLLMKLGLRLCAVTCYNVGYPRYAELLGKAGGGVAVRESRYGKVSDLKAEMQAFLESLKPDVDLAEKHDSWIAIENHGDALLSTLDSFKAFADLNTSPRLGIALAPYHLQAAKIPVEDVIAIAGKSLFFFYAWQHGEGLNQLPGVGPTDCTPWLSALAKADYRRYVNPFMHGHPEPDAMASALARSVGSLKECHARARRRETAGDPAGVRVARDIEYVPGGGRSRSLDLYLPEKAGGPLPLVIWVHGGAFLAGDKASCPAVRLASAGYAVASINYRLSGEALFPAQIEDCKAAVRWLRAHAKEKGLDPDRFGAWGSSAGGHLVAMLGTTGDVKDLEGDGGNAGVSSRVQVVCDWFGPTDFLQMDAHRVDDRAQLHDPADSPESRLVGGPIQENEEKVRRANPITYVSPGDPPFLILHGDRDPLVPHHQSVLLEEALRKAGVPVTFHTVKGAGHGFGGPEVDAMVDAFFERHLKSRPAGGR